MLKVENRNILIVEDDDGLRRSVSAHFAAHNNVVQCATLSEAKAAASRAAFDIVLLDVILPDGSGLHLIADIPDTPVIIFSDLGFDSNILDGFSSGATDYIVKPASLEIIEARMALRLISGGQANISINGLTLNVAKRTATYIKKPLDLTSSEFNILAFLMQNAGNFFTANEIYERVWKQPHLNTTTIKAHLSNLRKKMLSVSQTCANLIVTEFGKGYAFTGGN